MQSFDIMRKSDPSKSFRVESIKSQFDLNIDKVEERFQGEFDLPDNWSIGVIYGASGTGKTTIARELFPDQYISGFKYDKKSIVDDMPKGKTTEEITKAFNSVGFGTVWSWLKPYSVLSNGEKMRVDLARSILEERDLIVFDEYTSVINREVAKSGSFAIQKAIRKLGKKFIAVSCHSDIIDWLDPDWTFYTDSMEFDSGRSHRRPEIKIKVYRTKTDYWKIFRKYHYLTSALANNAHCYVAFLNEIPIAFNAVIPQPCRNKKLKRSHRLVVLPDYQGLGIGHRLSNFVADIYISHGYDFHAVNSNRLLYKTRMRDPAWILKRSGKIKSKAGSKDFLSFNDTRSINRNTYTFKYIGESNGN